MDAIGQTGEDPEEHARTLVVESISAELYNKSDGPSQSRLLHFVGKFKKKTGTLNTLVDGEISLYFADGTQPCPSGPAEPNHPRVCLPAKAFLDYAVVLLYAQDPGELTLVLDGPTPRLMPRAWRTF